MMPRLAEIAQLCDQSFPVADLESMLYTCTPVLYTAKGRPLYKNCIFVRNMFIGGHTLLKQMQNIWRQKCEKNNKHKCKGKVPNVIKLLIW